MKLNYYTYTIQFIESGTTSKLCIKDIVDIFCLYQKDKTKLEKINTRTSKKLYFARADSYDSVYYLMTPTDLKNYRSLDKSSGVIKDLSELIGDDSLEKVSYIHFDKKLPIIAISASHGGATDEDLEFYLNQLLNGMNDQTKYIIKIKPLNSNVSKSQVKNLKMISEAKVLLRSDSNQISKLNSFLNAGSSCENIEIEIKIKRTKGSTSSIGNNIEPLLSIIEGDSHDRQFANVSLRGKQYSLQENIKDILLDQSMILFDPINPNAKSTIEEQIEHKRFTNLQVERLAEEEFDKYASKLKTNIPCALWGALKIAKSYAETE